MCRNGTTELRWQLPVTTSSSALTYAVELEHYLCRGRSMCVVPAVQPTSTATAVITGYTDIGNNSWVAEVVVSGTLTYQPYGPSCQCLRQEPWVAQLNIPISATTEPTATIAAGTPVTAAIAPSDCRCNLTNAVSIMLSLEVTLSTTA